MTSNTAILKIIVGSAYDAQKLRIATGNRICQAWYQSAGVEPGTKPAEEMSPKDERLLKTIRDEYKLLAEGLASRPRRGSFIPTAMLTSYALVTLIGQYETLLTAEQTTFRDLGKEVELHPMWPAFLRDINGIGPAMAGALLTKLDPHLADTASGFWRYAGLDVGPDGRGRGRYKEHLVKREYITKDGKTETKMGITFDPWLKTKLRVLAEAFIKAQIRVAKDEDGKKIPGSEHAIGPYGEIYLRKKRQLETQGPRERTEVKILNHKGWHWTPAANIGDIRAAKKVGEQRTRMTTDWAGTTPGHRHAAAMRYMLKMFLRDFWWKWRTLEGLPARPAYDAEKLAA